MKNLIAPLLLLVSSFTLAVATAAEPTAFSPLGHYYLEGVREVGSEIILKKNGEFAWMLIYGNEDLQANGKWHMSGNDVTLISDLTEKSVQFRMLDENELHLRRGAETGVWIACVGVEGMGPVAGMEAKFQAESGVAASAVSLPNGDAIVTMPASEKWSRIGLRRNGSADAFQWMAIPPKRSRERIAAFRITNAEVLARPPFKELFLHIEKGGLRIADPENRLSTGIYARHGKAD